MTKDLEETLNELGPEYRSVVARLRAPFVPRPRRYVPYLVAASLVAAVAVSAVFLRPAERPSYTVYTVAYANDEFALRAILASQQSDGSWSNDYLTMQNAAALRRAHDETSQIAYKRAVRYLRTKGLGPISDAELQERSDKMKLPKTDWFLI